jgi:uncharacterized protein
MESYRRAAQSAEIAPALRREQNRWLAERAKCSTSSCLVALYRKRISQLQAVRCMARVRSDTPAVESPSAILKKGEEWGPVTQVRVNKKSGEISYCAHGDYCYRASGIELFACIISAKPDSEDTDEWTYNPS